MLMMMVMVMMMTMHAVVNHIKIMVSGQLEHTIIRITSAELLLLLFMIASPQQNCIKMKTCSLWLCGLLSISLAGAHGLSYFPENFVVAKRNTNPITLTCGAKTDGGVTWKFDGEVMEDDSFEENIQQNGSELILSEVDTPMLGEYSCWREGKMLSSTYVLLEDEEEEELDSFMNCRAKSYDCSFSCTWTHSGYAPVRLGLGQDCRQGLKSCRWVNSSEQLQDGGFHFELPHSISPYAEESNKLELTAEAIFDHSILRRTKSFYLRDIVQPDSPKIVKCQEVDQDLNVTIDPPSTWSTPHSYFTLEHQIEYVLKDDGRPGRSSSALIPKGISKLRVRCRDPLVVSAWSQWTPWKNVRAGKKTPCRCRKKEGRKKGGKKERSKKERIKMLG